MPLRLFLPLFSLLCNGMVIGWGSPSTALLWCTAVMLLAGLLVGLLSWGDRLTSLFFVLLALAPTAGFWVGFLLHKVL